MVGVAEVVVGAADVVVGTAPLLGGAEVEGELDEHPPATMALARASNTVNAARGSHSCPTTPS